MATLVDWLDRFLYGDQKEVSLNTWTGEENMISSLWAYRLALNIAAERLGSALSRCDFKTYVNGEQVEGENYYLLNFEPNPNQSAAEFRKQLIRRLIFSPKHDALVVVLDNVQGRKQCLYVAEEFERDEYQVNETYFKNVSINVFGDESYMLSGVYSGNRAIYIKYANAQLNIIFDQMKKTYLELIDNAKKAGTYRMKYVLSMDTTAENSPDFEENMQDILDNQFGAFIKGENAVLPLYAGMKLDQTSAGADLGQNASVANKSVNNEIDDAITKVGLAFNIPMSFMLGNYENDDMEPFLMFCVDPLAELITQAFNRKWYGKKSIQGGTYCWLDTKQARHYDLFTIGTTVNKIISSGVYTINEIRKELGETQIDPSIGDIHWITRNYAAVGDYVSDPNNTISVGGNNSDD